LYLHEPKVKLDLGRDIFTHKFQFDHVFDENATNKEVFDVIATPMLETFKENGSATIFAYGQTGTNSLRKVVARLILYLVLKEKQVSANTFANELLMI
jgi:hypothetical protein